MRTSCQIQKPGKCRKLPVCFKRLSQKLCQTAKTGDEPRKNPEPKQILKPGILKGEDKYYFYLL